MVRGGEGEVPVPEVEGLVSQIKMVDGVEKRGFKVFVAGGTSIMPRLAQPLYDFLPEEDILRLALALFTVFNNAEMLRKNRMMARLKVLVDRIGLEEFKILVEAELKNIGPIDPKPYMDVDELMTETPPALAPNSTNGHDHGPDYAKWYNTNVEAQKQEGYYVAHVKPERGNLSASQFHALATIMAKYTGGRARVSQEQNLLLRFIPEHMLHDVFDELTKHKYQFPADQIEKPEYFEKLQEPLNITVTDIQKELTKFVNDFPIDIIPH